MGFKLTKLVLFVFVGWFVWVSWRAVPYFSGGLDQGLAYYQHEASQVLGEFAAAGERIARAVRIRVEAMNLFASAPAEERPPKGRYRTLEE